MGHFCMSQHNFTTASGILWASSAEDKLRHYCRPCFQVRNNCNSVLVRARVLSPFTFIVIRALRCTAVAENVALYNSQST